MIISLKQVDLVIGQHIWTPWKPQIKKPTIETQKLKRKKHKQYYAKRNSNLIQGKTKEMTEKL